MIPIESEQIFLDTSENYRLKREERSAVLITSHTHSHDSVSPRVIKNFKFTRLCNTYPQLHQYCNRIWEFHRIKMNGLR